MSTKENIKIKCRDGEAFQIGDMEFIKFPTNEGQTPVMMKGIAFRSRFGESNDLRTSTVLKRLQEECLPKVIESIGEENLCTIRTDLTTLDGLKSYGVMESLVSLPTLDFYREHTELFDKYNPSDWWWLATADSAQPHCDPEWVLCVSPSGYLGGYRFSYDASASARFISSNLLSLNLLRSKYGRQ